MGIGERKVLYRAIKTDYNVVTEFYTLSGDRVEISTKNGIVRRISYVGYFDSCGMIKNREHWQTITHSGAHHPILFIDTVFYGYRRGVIGKFFGIQFNPSHYRQFNGARWWISEEVNKYIRVLRNKETKSPGTLLKKANEYYQLNKNFLAWSKRKRRINFRKLTDKKLLKTFQQCIDQLSVINALVYTAAFLDKFYTDDIIEIINTKITDPTNQHRILTTIFSIPYGLESHFEKVALLRLARRKRDGVNERELKRLIDTHCARFGSVFMMPFQANLLSAGMVALKIDILARNKKKYNALEMEVKKLHGNERELRTVCAGLRLSPKEKRKIDTLRMWTFVANNDDPYVMGSLYLLQPLWNELARRLNLTFEQLIELRIQEVEKFMSTGVSVVVRQELKLRKSAALIWDYLGIRLLTGRKLADYTKVQEVRSKKERVYIVKGISVSQGRVKGKVHILRSIYDISKVRKDCVLLAPYTYPAIVTAMQKACAIVTDQGGLLSHAAIVSREMKKPCIVGTKIATRVFKDGDIVEVDATKGVVRKIK